MRRKLIPLLVIMILSAGAAFALAFAIEWLPEQASVQGKRIDQVIWLTVVICVVVFAIVAAASVYAVVKFRAKPGDEEDGPPLHGHTGLEITWTAIPTALVTVIAVWSGIVVVQNDRLPEGSRVVLVEARQFAWGFEYPELGGIRTGELFLPVNQPVELRMASPDVIHAFWVPEWRQKQDVVPGITTFYRITPTKEGIFPIVCTELCGLGHSVMRNQVNVMSEEAFEGWLAEQRAGVDAGGTDLGLRVFANQGCAGCHALAEAGASGAGGPDLDSVLLGQSAEQIRESIMTPDATISEGFSSGFMPSYSQLPDEQVEALVEFLLGAAGGSSG